MICLQNEYLNEIYFRYGKWLFSYTDTYSLETTDDNQRLLDRNVVSIIIFISTKRSKQYNYISNY